MQIGSSNDSAAVKAPLICRKFMACLCVDREGERYGV